MKLNLDDYEKDLLIETINHRLDSDDNLIICEGVKEDLVELLRKVEDDDYV